MRDGDVQSPLSMRRESDGCRRKCGMHGAKWWSWFATRFCESPETALAAAASTAVTSNTGLAMLMIPANIDGYMELIGAKSRNMVRKAQKHFAYSTYSTGGHLQDLFEINTSMEIRCGRPMSPAYLDFPQKRDLDPGQYCPEHTTFHLGAFTGSGKLAAYIELVRMGELGIINRILGHNDHLPNGVMNGLVHFMVTWSLQTASLQTGGIREINYLTLTSATVELDRFKRSVGFVPKTLTLRQS